MTVRVTRDDFLDKATLSAMVQLISGNDATLKGCLLAHTKSSKWFFAACHSSFVGIRVAPPEAIVSDGRSAIIPLDALKMATQVATSKSFITLDPPEIYGGNGSIVVYPNLLDAVAKENGIVVNYTPMGNETDYPDWRGVLDHLAKEIKPDRSLPPMNPDVLIKPNKFINVAYENLLDLEWLGAFARGGNEHLGGAWACMDWKSPTPRAFAVVSGLRYKKDDSPVDTIYWDSIIDPTPTEPPAKADTNPDVPY